MAKSWINSNSLVYSQSLYQQLDLSEVSCRNAPVHSQNNKPRLTIKQADAPLQINRTRVEFHQMSTNKDERASDIRANPARDGCVGTKK